MCALNVAFSRTSCRILSYLLADEATSFSLLYGPITLDFEAANPITLDFWLQGIIVAANNAKTQHTLSGCAFPLERFSEDSVDFDDLLFRSYLKELWRKKQTFGNEISYFELVEIMRHTYSDFEPQDSDFRRKFDVRVL